MDAENTQESGLPGEAAELPTPSFSEQGDSSTSVDADAIVSKLTPVIEQLIERKVQSQKDKRLSKIEKALGGRLDLLAELEELGQEIPKDVRMEMRLRELEGRTAPQSAQPASPSDAGPSQQKAAVSEAIAELNKYGLDPNDADFIGLLRGNYSNRAAFDLEVQRHIVKKIAPPKPAHVGDVVQAPVKASAAGKSPETLVSDYKKEMQAAPRGPKGDDQRRAIKNKYIQLGADIHSVDFTS